MSQPRAVKAQSELADRLHQEAYAAEPQPAPEPEQQPAPEQQTAPEQPAQQPAQQPAPEAQPAPELRREDTLDYWRSKFQTLEGKYRSEVPRLNETVRSLQNKIGDLERLLATQQDQKTQQAANEPVVKPEEMEEYGADFVDMLQRVAQHEARRAVSQVQPEIQKISEEVQTTQVQTAREKCYSLLNQNVDDWRAINQSREFLEWLAETDPFSGEIRKAMLHSAFQRGDAHRVLAFFQAFAQQRSVVTPREQSQEPPAQAAPQLDLKSLAAPRASGGSGTPPSSNQPQAWKRSQIAAFYADVRNGMYRSDPAKKQAIEKSINAAVAAGLVT